MKGFRGIGVVLCALLSVLTMSGNVALRGNCFYADARVVRPYLVDDLAGQRYLFGGKEREHAGGRNSYDLGSHTYSPDIARFMQPNSQNRYDFNFNGGALPGLEVLETRNKQTPNIIVI